MAEFKESEHPRDKDGKFTDKGSGQGWTKEKRDRLLSVLQKRNVIKLPDEMLPKSVGAKWGNYEIVMPDGSIAKFVEGSKIQDKEVFAGYGTRTPIRMQDWLNKKYGINSNKWQKLKAKAHIINNGEETFSEVHWYEEESVGKVEFKFKRYI